MIRGTTPTFILTIEDDIDLTTMDNVYVTMEQNGQKLTKTGTDLTISAREVDVFLSQRESLQFSQGNIALQINFTYENGKRGCTKIVKVPVSENLYDGELE